ncbi:MAG: hypothetical protein KJ601_03130 [Nanoarchaeota archaeon]|nr:hypothetical protein [Nanoarchaeota archaeon]MBU1704396.1 hypothetical protein [Nanoarchaeota archaeon]
MKLSDIKGKEFFAKGHRGVLYKGRYNGQEVVIKTKREDSEAIGKIENEARFLLKLNPKGIGPELISYNKAKDYIVYNYIEGEFFPIFLEKCKSKAAVLSIIKNVLQQCYQMDKMGIDKEEMHHPYKHIIIENRSKNPVMIDFERCRHTDSAKNVTQFATYLMSKSVSDRLKAIGIKIEREKLIQAAKDYKAAQAKKSFFAILRLLK